MYLTWIGQVALGSRVTLVPLRTSAHGAMLHDVTFGRGGAQRLNGAEVFTLTPVARFSVEAVEI